MHHLAADYLLRLEAIGRAGAGLIALINVMTSDQESQEVSSHSSSSSYPLRQLCIMGCRKLRSGINSPSSPVISGLSSIQSYW